MKFKIGDRVKVTILIKPFDDTGITTITGIDGSVEKPYTVKHGAWYRSEDELEAITESSIDNPPTHELE